ncbi:hypothetical protein PF004_g22609 [Phytophthora fragariae]|nr:hypothetical protein PF004_g22609 [Phytophthora fragariae]
MRLVEASALRKLPDISVAGARNLLTRFQSRNENSIRHIIDDWPAPWPAKVTSRASDISTRHQPYLEHPGFDFGSTAHGGAENPIMSEPKKRRVQHDVAVPCLEVGDLLTAVRLVTSERLPVHALPHVVTAINAFLDCIDLWTLLDAVKLGSERLLDRVMAKVDAARL